MGQRTKGSMWCDFCGGPVLGVKTTHRLRNAAALAASIPTASASVAGARIEGYKCSQCGQPVRHATQADFDRLNHVMAAASAQAEIPAPASPPEPAAPPAEPKSPGARKSELRHMVDSRSDRQFKTSFEGLMRTFAPGRPDTLRTREKVAEDLRTAGLAIRENLATAKGAVTVCRDWTQIPADEVPPRRPLDRQSLDRLAGQNQRAAARSVKAEAATDDSTEPISSLADELQKLSALHAAGALTDEEYSVAKSRLLGI